MQVRFRGFDGGARGRLEIGLHQLDGCLHRAELIAECFNPMDVWLAAKPGELALGIVAMALLGCGYRLSPLPRTIHHGSGLSVAEGVERLDGAVAREETAGFFHEAGGKHGGGTLVEALVKFLARRIEADAQEAEAGKGIAGR